MSPTWLACLCQVLRYGGFYRLARRYLDYGLDQMLGSIFISRSVKELQKYVPQVGFLECLALGTCQKDVPQVGFLADRMHVWLHLHLQISQRAPEVCPSGRISRMSGSGNLPEVCASGRISG
jgi:hypothetical protein